jgi:HPt (histidine-containing phosphotransfer) domain-containing protein
MDGYLSKPVRRDELRRAIDQHVATGEPTHSGAPHEVADEPPQPLDWQTALAALDGDERLLRDVVQAFVDECPKWMTELQQAIARQDSVSTRRLAHTIKGGMRLFEDPASRQTALQLEEQAAQGDLHQAEQLATRLQRQLARFLPQLSAYVGGGNAENAERT